MASTNSPTLPEVDQQPELAVPGGNPEELSSNSLHYSSGPIGPFVAVMSVLIILSVLSCILPRIFKGRKMAISSPLDNIMGRGCLGWFRRKCFGCIDNNHCNNNVQVLGEEIVSAQKDGKIEKKGQDAV